MTSNRNNVDIMDGDDSFGKVSERIIFPSEKKKRLGYWMSQKKCKKLSLYDIESALRRRNIEPVKMDLEKSLESQGPFDGILHKLTDFIALADAGDIKAQNLIQRVESYLQDNPNTLVMDSIECLRTVINRYETYCVIARTPLFNQELIAFIPPFVELRKNDFESNIELMRQSNVRFPAVCKPVVAHGSSSAHQMTLIFNERGLKDISVYPCVLQTFINHNATIYKLFCMGNSYTTVLRPSIKNFHNFEDMTSIHFDGGDISKAKPTGELSIQGNFNSNGCNLMQPCSELLDCIVRAVGDCLGLRLFGIDVMVESSTGRVGLIDVNAFPGYEGVDDFPERLADFVKLELDKAPKPIPIPRQHTNCGQRENKLCNGGTAAVPSQNQ